MTVAPAPDVAKMSLNCRASFGPQVCVTGWPIGVPSVAVSVNVTAAVNAAGLKSPAFVRNLALQSPPLLPRPTNAHRHGDAPLLQGSELRTGRSELSIQTSVWKNVPFTP